MKNKQIQNTIKKVADLIQKSQNDDGSFFSSTAHSKNKEKTNQFKTTYYTSIILSLIADCEINGLEKTKEKSVIFLERQKSDLATFNYWSRDFIKKVGEIYPDDLDDTACGLSAILMYKKELITQADLAGLTKVLVNLEASVGGPYYTWVLSRVKKGSKWAHVDLIVNANINFLLSHLEIHLPNITSFIDEKIGKKDFCSIYYPSPNSSLYFITRAYNGKKLDQLVRFIRSKNNIPFSNPLECALLGLSLFSLTNDPTLIEQNVKYLLTNQKEDGTFGIYPFVIETGGRISGSEALTSAFVLNFLYKVSNSKKMEAKTKVRNYLSLKSKVIRQCVSSLKSSYGSEMAITIENFLDKLLASEKNWEIFAHPFVFCKSLKTAGKLKENFVLKLAIANTLGWVAYTIYDNIMDEGKDIDKLALANACSHQLQSYFCQNDNFTTIFQGYINRVDAANLAEEKITSVKDLRNTDLERIKNLYKNINNVAEKSIAHSLAPLAILYQLGFDEYSKQFQNLELFFQAYLTARQLNDDAHDWEADLKVRKITFCNWLLLTSFYKNHARYPDFKKDLKELRRLFWREVILEICQIIKEKVNLAKEKLESLSQILNDGYLRDKLQEFDNATKIAMGEREKTIKYLDSLFMDT